MTFTDTLKELVDKVGSAEVQISVEGDFVDQLIARGHAAQDLSQFLVSHAEDIVVLVEALEEIANPHHMMIEPDMVNIARAALSRLGVGS
jgi:hypothetical protein